ncbi:MAG: HAD-IIIA family hydrolase [Calothrix sp. FI2-JRJ7]|jgi:D-glycero-D-manno-heptose 1,7-bisphosphate phosphatase|nr:HAD-IIIA family hydrolase [Calothrix sp. FI2-JRJ7]
MKIIFFDVDGTLTETVSGATFKQHSQDVKLLPGIESALQHFDTQGYLQVGISNQGGVAAGHKTIKDTIAEMQFTLSLAPQLRTIYFCPDFEGKTCWKLKKHNSSKIKQHNTLEYGSFRKPGKGMIELFLKSNNVDDRTAIWMIGDRQEDEQCASNAHVKFMDALDFRKMFIADMDEFKHPILS